MQNKKQQESGVKEETYMEKIEIVQAEAKRQHELPWVFIQEGLLISGSIKKGWCPGEAMSVSQWSSEDHYLVFG